jgi:acetyltransferase-like isoleucine patch superfamily enzyme
MSALKLVSSVVLNPFAVITERFVTPFQRAWSHARLASKINGKLDPSVVILGVPEVHGTRQICVGRNLYLYRDLYLETQGNGVIEIGDGVVMSRGVHIVAFARVTIGDGSMIGEYSSIRDANHRLVKGQSARNTGHDAGAITIGQNVWVGRGVTILKGVSIGDGAVVGANAVVSRDVPPGSIVVGIPAKPVGIRSLG